MKLAVIGAGNVGGTLARRWSALGHEVVLGLREPASAKSRAQAAELGLAAMDRAAAARVLTLSCWRLQAVKRRSRPPAPANYRQGRSWPMPQIR